MTGYCNTPEYLKHNDTIMIKQKYYSTNSVSHLNVIPSSIDAKSLVSKSFLID